MRPDKDKPYYTAYDKRYSSVYEQGADYYAYLPMDKEVREIVKKYIRAFNLSSKKIVEFGCGQGRAGLEFAKRGCIYRGYDISPAALEKATALLSKYPNATVSLCDIVLGDFSADAFDAGIDIASLHMLITDADRKKYLRNVYICLKPGAPMYFVHENQNDIYNGEVTSYEQWLELTGEDVDTLEERKAIKNEKAYKVLIPRIAARPRSTEDYRKELTEAGFDIFKLETNKKWRNINILVRKPNLSSE